MSVKKVEIPDLITVEIEKLSNLGYGIAKYNGYVVFVEKSCPLDILKVRLYKKNKNYGYAKIEEIITPSKYRVKPFCPMQNVCGACQLQFIDYDAQLKFKKEIVKDTMTSIYGHDIKIADVIKSPETKEFRHKIQYPVSETKDSKRIVAGYYKPSSHDIVNIKYCPIQPEICDNIIEFIKNTAKDVGVTGYVEKINKGDLKHIVIRNSDYSKKNLVILVVNSDKMSEKYIKLANKIYENFDEVTGVGINFNPKRTNVILGKTTKIAIGEDYIEEKLCDKIFKIGADTFFQVNPKSADNIFHYVKNYIKENYNSPVVLDAYSGISTFGICLSDICKKIVCVEEVKESVKKAEESLKHNNISNIELNNSDAQVFFENECKTRKKYYDISVIDPPRKGCTKESLDYVCELTKNQIIYVSCNPSTLARDLKYLTEEKNCTIEFIQPFDMFCHSYHIENVAIINL